MLAWQYAILSDMIESARLKQIQKRIAKIKAELTAIDEMRPGSLTEQYKDPASQSGAYFQISYTLGKRSRTEYVPRDCVRDVRRQIENYRRFKDLTAEWIAFSIEQSRLKVKLERKA